MLKKLRKKRQRCDKKQVRTTWLGKYLLPFALAFTVSSNNTMAEDKSGSRSGLVKLPTAGGTVNGESASFSVNSNKGASHFSLPLPNLPGRAGVTPGLSLDYSQFNADEGFGQGWRLSVPSIEISQELGIPVSGLLPNGDFRRVLSFMGQDLIFVGKRRDVAMFELESGEQSLRVNYHSKAYSVSHAHTVSGEQPGFTQGFEVIYPDGRRQLFSGDLNVVEGGSGQETRFPLTYEIAPHGESVRYAYTQQGGHSYLTDVWFAGGVSHYQFELMANPFPRLRYDNGVAQHVGKRYSKLVARVSGEVHAQYCFAYRGRASTAATDRVVRSHSDCQTQAEAHLSANLAENSLTVQEQLVAVFRYGNDARLTASSLTLPTAYFDYTEWDASRLASRDLVYTLPALTQSTSFRSENFELADLNHDGLVDVVRLNSDGTSSRFMALGEQENLFGEAEHWQVKRGPRYVSPSLRSDNFHFADLNGDTYLDLLEFYDNEAVVYLGEKGGNFAEGQRTRLSKDNSLGAKHFKDGKARWVDFNQDGRSDVLTTDAGTGNGRVLTLYLNLSYQKPNGEWVYYLVPKQYQSPYPSAAFELSDNNVQLQDVNGDRLPDLLHLRPSGRANESGVCVYYNRGDIYRLNASDSLFGDTVFDSAGRCGVGGQFVALTGLGGVNTLSNLWLVDVNGDGIQDYAMPGSNRQQLWVWLGLGDGQVVPTPMKLPLNLPLNLNLDDGSRSRIVDIDGDSQAEILLFDDQAPSERRVLMLDFNRNANNQLIRTNLLTHVEFDSGLRHDILYVTSTDERVRDQKLGRAVSPLHFPVVLAKQLISSYGVMGELRSNVKVEEFFYHEPFFNPREKQFNGFGEVNTLVYGDDYAGQSHLQVRRYHTQGDDLSTQALAGMMKEEHIFTVKADAGYELITQQNIAFDPTQAGAHSLSTATRQQLLPEGDRLLQSRFIDWEAVERSRNLSVFTRQTEITQEVFGTSASSTDGKAKTTISYSDFDEYNMPQRVQESIDEVSGPFGVTIPASVTVQEMDYSLSREVLEERDIISSPANILVTRNDEFISYTEWTYYDTGLVESELRYVESNLDSVPESIEAHFVPFAEYYREFNYDLFGNQTSAADDISEIESVVYGEHGVFPESYSKARVNGHQQTWKLMYEGGRLKTLTTPLGVISETSYDSLGRKSVLTDTRGSEINYDYHQGINGLPSYIKRTTRRYSSAKATPDGESTFIEQLSAFHADGTQLAQVEDADLEDDQVGIRVLSYATFNRNKQVVFQWTPYTIGGKTVADIFKESDLPKPDEFSGTTLAYDPLGRLKETLVPSGKIKRTEYFSWGQKDKVQYQSNNRQVIKETSRMGNALGIYAIAESNGANLVHLTRFDRDARGYLSAIQLPGDSAIRELVHDSAGRLEYQKLPGMGEQYKVYDARNREVAMARIASDGLEEHSVVKTFDALDRVLTTYFDGNLHTAYRYDNYSEAFKTEAAYESALSQPLGLLTEVYTIDPNGLFNFKEKLGYDSNEQIVHQEVEIADKLLGESFSYTLDGTAHKTTNPLGLEGRYQLGRDQNLRSVFIRLPGEAEEQSVIEQIAYNSRGQIQNIRYREMGDRHAQTTLTYEPSTLQLTDINSYYIGAKGKVHTLQDLHIDLDQNNSITGITDWVGDTEHGHVSRSGRFEYNWKDELISATRYGKQHHYAYSAAGNFTRNTELAEGALQESSVTAMLPQGEKQGDYAFDGFGQLIKSPSLMAAQYNALGQLIMAVTENQILRFGYNASGMRVYKQVEPREDSLFSRPQLALYPLESIAFEPTGTQSYLFVGDSRLVRLEHATNEWFYYLKDHIGSSDIVMNSSGIPVEQMLYHAYGNEESASALSPRWQQHREDNAELLPRERTHHRFTGQYLDDESGLYNFGKRYYDPKLGRFISPDPLYVDNPQACLQSPRECNLYIYAFNNPMKFIDPTGLNAVEANKDENDNTKATVTTGDDGNSSTDSVTMDNVEGSSLAIDSSYQHTGSEPPKLIEGVTILRMEIEVGPPLSYGHYWIEIDDTESYGWWPTEKLSRTYEGLMRTVSGVGGDLNGQAAFHGTPTRDPHHGDRGPRVDVYNVYSTKSKEEVVKAIREYAKNYSGGWSWPIGKNCHSFQRGLMKHAGLTIRKAK